MKEFSALKKNKKKRRGSINHGCILTIRVFGVQLVLSRTAPRQQVVIATIRHPVIPDTNDFVLRVHDARSYL